MKEKMATGKFSKKHYDSDDTVSGEERLPLPGEERKRRLSRIWERFKAWVMRIWEPVWARLRKFVSVPFLVVLFLSFATWYVIKLNHTYKTDIPITVSVEGYEFEVDCMVEGQGTRLFGRKFHKGKPLELRWSDLDVSPSALNPGWVVISPYSLQNAISARNTELKILSVGPVPEIEL